MKDSEVLEKASVSVIIPCYCCSATIERAVDSVANQTQLPQQLILIDDGSLDDGKTLQALNHLKDKYFGCFQIDIIALGKNQGVSVARNAGWNIATEDYIAFLDSDDAWHPRKVEFQYTWMKNNLDVYLSGHDCVQLRQGALFPSITYTWTTKNVSKWSLLLKNKFPTPSVMVINSPEYRFHPEKRYREDTLLWLEMACDDRRLEQLNISLAYIYKAPYGDSGLSGHLWLMEKEELVNYKLLLRKGELNYVSFLIMFIYSIAKFLRRVVKSFLQGMREN